MERLSKKERYECLNAAFKTLSALRDDLDESFKLERFDLWEAKELIKRVYTNLQVKAEIV